MEAARIKKEVDGREREREGNSSARNFARRCSYVFAQSSTTTDRHNNERLVSKRLSISNWPGHGREDVRGVEGKNRKNF